MADFELKGSKSLIHPLFRRERLDGQRFHAYRLVIELVAVAAVEGVLEPVNIIALGVILA